ncbi:DMT family transporter [Phreatobacter oligotrophus]|uniref:DMT family transporter n=1 Tax=Phreatobacter oligotrophus TaxID=1122261 RepID=UPI00235548AC|nr:DMT family transporter [Phreatobacter oligotrophus]MBX9990732.1 DMT family transporter [Phreatobacter oligotrophus]
MSAPAEPRDIRRGMGLMTLGMLLFATNDALVKAHMGALSVAQALGVRGIFATIGVAAFLMASGTRLTLAGYWHPLVVGRSLAEGLAVFFLFQALWRMPIGDVTAVSQSMPLFLLPIAVLVLGEKVSPVQWALVILGFIGIVLIAKPASAGFDPAIGLVIGTTICFVLRDVTVKFIPPHIASATVTFSTVSVVMAAALALATIQGLGPMGVKQTGMLGLAGLLLAAGQAAIITALRMAPVSQVGPFNYTKTAFAVVIGILFFGERPDLITAAGIGLVALSGILIASGLGRPRA